MLSDQLREGQQVLADNQLVGRLVETLHEDGERYLHVRRFTPIADELYIPARAVQRIEGNRVFLGLRFGALVGAEWHLRPGMRESAA